MLTTLTDIDVRGKTVLLRADLNVPVDDDGNVRDTTRIDRLKPTIDYLHAQHARVLILSHFGRPKGAPDQAFSLGFLAPVCARAWGVPVDFIAQSTGPSVRDSVASLPVPGILLLENVRFHAGEEKNDPALAIQWAELGDVYVNDAFSVSHRAHASVEALARLRPAAAGFLMAEELDALERVLEHPARPVVAVVGGSKISTKIDLLLNLVVRVDHIVLGGGMANTFLMAQGLSMGGSLCEPSMREVVERIVAKARETGCRIHLPVDGVVALGLSRPETARIQDLGQGVDAEQSVLDIGSATIAAYGDVIATARTVLWNGPMGVFETPAFANGTRAVGQAIAAAAQGGVISVAGGGDTLAALAAFGLEGSMSYASSAGGAFLEYCEGKALPGVAVLMGS